MTDETGTGAWLVVSVSTAGGAAGLRVLVWRKLRSLGALYLQQPVCLLPATADVARDARRRAGRAAQPAASARSSHGRPPGPTRYAGDQRRAGHRNAAPDVRTESCPT